MKAIFRLETFIVVLFCLLQMSCDNVLTGKSNSVNKANYKEFKDDVLKDPTKYLSDTSNIFDKNAYDPKADTIDLYMQNIGRSLEEDSNQIKALGINDSGILVQNIHADSSVIQTDSFTNDIKKISPEEIKALKYNLEIMNNPATVKSITSNCKKIDCKVWVHVSKSKQRLYLYVDGALVDTFKVSTGDKKHETPNFDTRPNGIMFQKYTSKKYPGGNYNGLGNMPYVVFIKGGYGIHGTTLGNFKKLGTRASHGCIRLHPDNAKILFELIKVTGSNNTWITVSAD